MGNIFYAETDGNKYQNSTATWEQIPGLNLYLPAATATDNCAVITLNAPMAYSTGTNYPGGNFTIFVDGVSFGPYASFTADSIRPQGFGRRCVSLLVKRDLDLSPHFVQAMWMGANGGIVTIDTKASLSAITGLH